MFAWTPLIADFWFYWSMKVKTASKQQWMHNPQCIWIQVVFTSLTFRGLTDRYVLFLSKVLFFSLKYFVVVIVVVTSHEEVRIGNIPVEWEKCYANTKPLTRLYRLRWPGIYSTLSVPSKIRNHPFQ